jgi:hypothetical protein
VHGRKSLHFVLADLQLLQACAALDRNAMRLALCKSLELTIFKAVFDAYRRNCFLNGK